MKQQKQNKFSEDVVNFVQGNGYWLEDALFGTVPVHIKEQALYRAMLCSPCLENGKCLHCGCKTPNMFYSPRKSDKLGLWGSMLKEKDWNRFKRDNNIKIPKDFKSIKDKPDDRLTEQFRHHSELLESKQRVSSIQGVQELPQEGQVESKEE